MPIFSVIIPIYNTAAYLADCLQSVVCQLPEQEVEIICINDGSTDDSVAVLQPYLERYPNIRLINQPNAGLSAARNAGLQLANGDFILFVDSDDMLLPNALTTLQQTVLLHPSVDIVAFGSELWYPEEDGRRLPNTLFNHTESKTYATGINYLDYFVSTRGWGPSAACFYCWKREILWANGLLFPNGLLHEDELFVPQVLCYAQNVLTIQTICYQYRMRGTSIGHTFTLKHAEDKLLIADELSRLFTTKQLKSRITDRLVYNLRLNGLISYRKLHLAFSPTAVGAAWKCAHGLKEHYKLISKLYL